LLEFSIYDYGQDRLNIPKTAEHQQALKDAPSLARKAMLRGGVVALVGTGLLTGAALHYLDVQSVFELGTESGRRKVGPVLQPIADAAERCVRGHEKWLSVWAEHARPSVMQVQKWADSKKELSGGDVSGLLGVHETVLWMRERVRKNSSVETDN